MYASCWWYHLFALGLPCCPRLLVTAEGESRLWHVQKTQGHVCVSLIIGTCEVCRNWQIGSVPNRIVKIDLPVEMPLEMGLCLFLHCIRKQKSPRALALGPLLQESALTPHVCHLCPESCFSPWCAQKSFPPKRGMGKKGSRVLPVPFLHKMWRSLFGYQQG